MKTTGLAALLLALAAAPALAQVDVPSPWETAALLAPDDSRRGAALTHSDVEAFSDGLVPAALAQGDMAGAVVVVVEDGRILFSKGYGVADVATRAPVDPERTLFRPGSVSKLFTWTAVMQLVEQGKLDLDADVNRYLDFAIPPAFGKPVTMRNLMTHSAGFEETLRPLLLGNPHTLEPLNSVLKEALPPRIFPPGEVPAYSNYGATLAGYIVQRVSGEPFDDYVARHIFGPLGMRHATFAQPLPKNLLKDMSKGYEVASGPATAFEMVSMGPAGGLSASGNDIARFMIAHLDGGAYGNARILSPEMTARMHDTALQTFPHLLPMAYGFYRSDRNGWTIIAHGGDTGAFHSNLALLPKAGVGIFLSVNSAGAGNASGRLRSAYLRGFMNRYFPAPSAAALPTLKSAPADGRKIAGSYRISRRGDSSFMRLFDLLEPQTISVNSDATISVSALKDPAGNVKRWREVGPFLWQEVNGNSHVEATFRDGRVFAVGTDDFGPIAVLQPAGFAAGDVDFLLLIATYALLALAVVFGPVKALLRWRYERPLALTGRARLLYTLSRVVALIDLVFLVGFPLVFLYATGRLATLDPSIDLVLRALQVLGAIGVLGAVVPVAHFVLALLVPARLWWTKV
ncbi:MAG TPA: serine hydrolase domain-containing protein, partial [Rhizomicrobium sp.]